MTLQRDARAHQEFAVIRPPKAIEVLEAVRGGVYVQRRPWLQRCMSPSAGDVAPSNTTIEGLFQRQRRRGYDVSQEVSMNDVKRLGALSAALILAACASRRRRSSSLSASIASYCARA